MWEDPSEVAMWLNMDLVPRIWKGRGEVQAPQFGEMQAGHGVCYSAGWGHNL